MRTSWQRAIVTAIAAAGLLAQAACSADGDDRHSGGKSTKPTVKEPDFRDWLAPAEEIRIGNYRSISPCRLLEQKSVDEWIGPYSTSDNWIQEEYLDTSPARPADGFRWGLDDIDCHWSNGLSATKSVSVRLQQDAEPDATSTSWQLHRLGPPDEITENLTRWQQADLTSLDDPAAATALLSDLTADTATVVKLDEDQALSSSGQGPSLEDTVTPARGSSSEDFTFLGTHQNVTWELSVSGLGGHSDAVLLDMAAGMISQIRERLADPNLSQSPAPTIIGDTDVYGSTPILEPCAILDRAAFAQTGFPEIDPVERLTPPHDLTVPNTFGKMKSEATCTRGYTARNRPTKKLTALQRKIGTEGAVRVTLSVGYYPSEKDAIAYWNGGKLKPIKTHADVSARTPQGWIQARVGPYFLFLSESSASSVGCVPDFGLCTDPKPVTVGLPVLTKVFNTAVDNLRAQEAEALDKG